MKSEVIFNKDLESNSVYVMKVYNTAVSKVWAYFTQAELLDQWWAPEPWKCETITMDFTESGVWRYAMMSPDGEKIYSQLKYGEIIQHRSFDGMDAFCDEKVPLHQGFPQSQWLVGFTGIEEGTKVTVNIHFLSQEVMKQQMEMGFEEGFKMGLNQLDKILKKE